jgi:RHS repeat-associated protein
LTFEGFFTILSKMDTSAGNHHCEVSGGVATKYFTAGETRLGGAPGRGDAHRQHVLLVGEQPPGLHQPGDGRGGKHRFADPLCAFWGGEVAGGSQPDRLHLHRAAGFGLIDYNARYYSPVLGRFASADTLIPSSSNPLDFDRYSYVRNNPLRYIDPSGHCSGDPDDPNNPDKECWRLFNNFPTWYPNVDLGYHSEMECYCPDEFDESPGDGKERFWWAGQSTISRGQH